MVEYELRVIVEKVAVSSQEVVKHDTITISDLDFIPYATDSVSRLQTNKYDSTC
jgi:hypothetical protein